MIRYPGTVSRPGEDDRADLAPPPIAIRRMAVPSPVGMTVPTKTSTVPIEVAVVMSQFLSLPSNSSQIPPDLGSFPRNLGRGGAAPEIPPELHLLPVYVTEIVSELKPLVENLTAFGAEFRARASR